MIFCFIYIPLDTYFCLFLFLHILLHIKKLEVGFQTKFSFSGCCEGITLAIPIFLAILSVAKTKSPHYILPVLPLIAILTAKWTDRILEEGFFSTKLVHDHDQGSICSNGNSDFGLFTNSNRFFSNQ